jgi:hypothetical protein
VPGRYKYFAEQVSHHPPVSATVIIGEKGYFKSNMYRAKNKFAKGSLQFSNIYKEVMELTNFGERYDVQ